MRPTLSPQFIASHKRGRIIDALAELTAEQGYEATKISDVVKRAAVARKTLYDNFTGKEDVFLRAFDVAHEEVRGRVEEACEGAGDDWEAALDAGLEALLAYVAEQPALAHLCLVEARAATADSAARYDKAIEGFIEMARRSLPRDKRLPDTTEEWLVGGVASVLIQQMRSGGAERAPELLPELRKFILNPYIGVGLAQGA
ncbi:MAG TPA: TetR/AcrR family transcriptional regulator, partial [Solirubrobacterales bacterium]|nr:TetR/AcrR family transcriptional regulator [Solirubrobacterales bacterium]